MEKAGCGGRRFRGIAGRCQRQERQAIDAKNLTAGTLVDNRKADDALIEAGDLTEIFHHQMCLSHIAGAGEGKLLFSVHWNISISFARPRTC